MNLSLQVFFSFLYFQPFKKCISDFSIPTHFQQEMHFLVNNQYTTYNGFVLLIMPGICVCVCTHLNGFSFPRSAQEPGHSGKFIFCMCPLYRVSAGFRKSNLRLFKTFLIPPWMKFKTLNPRWWGGSRCIKTLALKWCSKSRAVACPMNCEPKYRECTWSPTQYRTCTSSCLLLVAWFNVSSNIKTKSALLTLQISSFRMKGASPKRVIYAVLSFPAVKVLAIWESGNIKPKRSPIPSFEL